MAEITLVLPRGAVERLPFLVGATGASSANYLVAQAIRLYDRVAIDVLTHRATLTIRHKNGVEEEIEL